MRARQWAMTIASVVAASVIGAIVLSPKVAVTRAPRAGMADPVTTLLQRVGASPRDARAHAQLGAAYLERARDRAEPSYLVLADRALQRSLELQPRRNAEAYAALSALANARHDFTGSVRWARRAIAVNPLGANAYGSLGDAVFELGKVRAADRAYERMVRLRPNVPSYVRVSYALQYRGRTRAAIGAMHLALDAAGPHGETAAWVRHQLGDIYAGMRRIDVAERQNRIGTSIAPGYVPPTVGIAEAHIARGELERALPIMRSAAHRLPTLEYMITLGDLYRALGRTDEAADQYAAVGRKLRDYRRAGVRADADFTVFYADHGLRLRAACREARAVYRQRPTAKTADALAWVLHARGNDAAAWRYARRAIAAAPIDATALFHAGVIAEANGDRHLAVDLMRRALRTDPSFSVVHAPAARRYLAAKP